MAFSAALALTDLNDFLGPSQECTKPVTVKEEPKSDAELATKPEDIRGSAATEIQIDHSSGAYYEIDAIPSTSSLGLSKSSEKLKKAEITLNDCLACSGCVTSAESVLVALQSQDEVYKVLAERPDVTPILSISPQSLASLATLHHLQPSTCLRRLRAFFRRELGFRLVFDTTFARHLSLLEGQTEFYERSPAYVVDVKGKGKAVVLEEASKSASFPLLASACPGWICYAEKTHGELLPFISAVKSPQQVVGSLVKEWLAPKLGLSRDTVYHVSVMPCYDKKLEASRPDFATADGNRDVDCVLTTGEVEKMLLERHVDLDTYLEDEGSVPKGDAHFPEEDGYMPSMLSHAGSASGSYLHNAIAAAIRAQPEHTLAHLVLDTRLVRGEDYVEYVLRSAQAGASGMPLFRGAKCYGFRNLQNVVRKIGRETGVGVSKGAAGKAVTMGGGLASRRGGRGGMLRRSAKSCGASTPTAAASSLLAEEVQERGFDFIEVMACPSGCVNGGGQIAPPKHPLPVKVDREGMPIVSDAEHEQVESELKIVVDQSDGHRVLSGKEWVSRVEELYWQLGGSSGTRKVIDESDTPMSIHETLRPYVTPMLHQREHDAVAGRIMDELASTKAEMAETAVRAALRTQYRAIESTEVNGLAVKW